MKWPSAVLGSHLFVVYRLKGVPILALATARLILACHARYWRLHLRPMGTCNHCWQVEMGEIEEIYLWLIFALWLNELTMF